VQREVAAMVEEHPPPPPQQPAQVETVVARTVEAGPSTGQAAGQATGQPAVGQAQQQEPEELLGKLYDPLLRRLKAELWLDRERRGALTDRWH
jgi:hypothetical protein